VPVTTSPLAVLLVHHAAITIAALEHHPVAVEHALPFSNGPPRAPRA
jgi:hypothetical protein